MQLWDELSMIYTTCLMLFASFSYARSSLFSFFLGVGLLGLSTFISVRHAPDLDSPCDDLRRRRYIITSQRTLSFIRQRMLF